jgi:hypothetical protein
MENYHLRFLGTIEVTSSVDTSAVPARPFSTAMITLAARAWEAGG